MASQSFYSIVINGTDVSSNFLPVLNSLSVEMKSGSVSDSATITVDDTDGRISMPTTDALVIISLGWVDGTITEVFRGKVNNVTSKGGRSGRTLSIGCTGMDTQGKTKEQKFKHYDQKTVSGIMQAAAQAAGVSKMMVDDAIGSTKLDYLAQHNESFVHLGHRLSRMMNGTFKIMGDRAVMVERNAGKSASGKPLIPITAAWGDNLIDWDMAPFVGRPRHKDTAAHHYDRKSAKWKTESATTKDIQALAKATARFPAADETEAKSRSKSIAGEADRNKGGGSVTINGEPLAQPEAPCFLAGTRVGIDGGYVIDAVRHSLDRSGGFVTGLTLKHPKA